LESENLIIKIYEIFNKAGEANVCSVLCGIVTIAFLTSFHIMKKRNKNKSIFLMSGPLLTVIIGVILNYIFNLKQYGLQTP
jgi:hypothetical protein